MKLRNSFQARISLFLALLLLVVIGAVYFAVKAVTITVASDQAEEQLRTGTRVFERFMDLRWRRIQYGLNWLTNDSDFRLASINGTPRTSRTPCWSLRRVFAAVISLYSTSMATSSPAPSKAYRPGRPSPTPRL